LTQRFSITELKLHRDAVYKLVAEGRLPPGDFSIECTENLVSAIVSRLRESDLVNSPAANHPIPAESLALLIAAACEERAILERCRGPDGFEYDIGKQSFLAREDQLAALLDARLIVKKGDAFYPTNEGLVLVDEIVSSVGRCTLTKAKCLACNMHFILCTFYPDRHKPSNIWCPECGQRTGQFIMWQQQTFGTIYEHVPGHSTSLG
jgi:hypothetical protein